MSTRIHCDQYGIPTDISELEAGGVSSQYCKPTGSDPVWRCPVCGQWWQLDLPDGDFWEPMSTLKAFLFYHVKWKAERKHRKAGI